MYGSDELRTENREVRREYLMNLEVRREGLNLEVRREYLMN